MDPKGAQAVLDVFSQSSPEVKNAKIDLSKTYTNKFVEAAGATARVHQSGRSIRSRDATGRFGCGGDIVSAASSFGVVP